MRPKLPPQIVGMSEHESYVYVNRESGGIHPEHVSQKPCCTCRRGMHSGRSSETIRRQRLSRPRSWSSSCDPNQSCAKWSDRFRTRNVTNGACIKSISSVYPMSWTWIEMHGKSVVSEDRLFLYPRPDQTTVQPSVNYPNPVGPPCKSSSGQTGTSSWTWREPAAFVAFPRPVEIFIQILI